MKTHFSFPQVEKMVLVLVCAFAYLWDDDDEDEEVGSTNFDLTYQILSRTSCMIHCIIFLFFFGRGEKKTKKLIKLKYNWKNEL